MTTLYTILSIAFLVALIVALVYGIVVDKRIKTRKAEFLKNCTQEQRHFLEQYRRFVNEKPKKTKSNRKN